MKNNVPSHFASTWEVIASCVSDTGDDASKATLNDLITYVEEAYDEDEVLKVLVWRAWRANASANPKCDPDNREVTGVLKAERDRAERWALYLEGKGDPKSATARSLWNGIAACLNPHTGELEEWFVGAETSTLEELTARYGPLPKGEPPATFN